MALEDPLVYGLFAAIAIISASFVIYAMRTSSKKVEVEKDKSKNDHQGLPFRVLKSIPREDASKAKDDLRMLDLEREILGDAIRKLYEAQADGKITEEERERLAENYKNRMLAVKESITRDESVVALHELESMQEDLLKLFSQRFDELNTKTQELRTRVDVTPIKEVTIPQSRPESLEDLEDKPETNGKEKEPRKRKASPPKPSPRTEAERRIEEIRSEVEKVLDRLEQMENED